VVLWCKISELAMISGALINKSAGARVVETNMGNVMRLGILCAILWFMPAVVWAEDNVIAPPVDEAAKDASFLKYRNALLQAVVARDTEAVIAFSDPKISLSFGGQEGHDDFREALNVPVENLAERNKPKAAQLREAYWQELETVLKMGGKFVEGGFSAPYTWVSPEPDHMDPYDVHYVIGKNVLMRSAGNINAPVIRHLSYNVVAVYPKDGNAEYQSVRLPDGTDGFVASRYLRFMLDYRANFNKHDGKWLMTSFLAGD
jgi:hypothetical protein